MVEGPEEQSKFRALAARYERLMFHVARQILPNEQDAEDAVQEAFLAIAKNFSKIFAVDSPKTKAFVVIVTESKAIDIARKNARQGQQVPLEDLPEAMRQLRQKSGRIHTLYKAVQGRT